MNQNRKIGILYALGAFGFWGLIPIYFKAIAQVSPLEILCHRVIWSVPLCAAAITLARQWPTVIQPLANRGVQKNLVLSSTLIAINWFIFIWAVNNGHVLESSLGYFINPLVNVLLGTIFLKERLRPAQKIAVLLAAAGTIVLTTRLGTFPWISLSLACTFRSYGFIRKTVCIESLAGLFVETSLLMPAALGYLIYLEYIGELSWGHIGWSPTLLMISAGAVTSLPLVLFAKGARLLEYSTLGLCQYITPTTQFLLAIFIYNEPFTTTHLVTFGLIWSGLAIYMTEIYRNQRGLAE
ncbi:MAG: EamA family transporter RarD [Deltaproteobacteria bacterium]|nr:EamA family transporter RarD [Deltaproteobacteria bacterium]